MDDVPGLLESLTQAAAEREEGCERYRCVTLDDVSALATRYGLATRQVSAFALEHGLLPLRYVKNIGTIGMSGQARLLQSRALLVGAGGIGGTAAELLARMGVGTIIIADPDVYDETNLNRQNFACSSALGRSKVDVTAERLGEINCDVDVIRHRVAAGRQNLPDMLAAVDVVIDALDNIDDRLSLQRACADAGVVMVHGAIAGTALQVATIYPGEAGLEGMLPPTDGEGKAQGVEVETGNPATTPVLAAVIQVQEAVKVLVGTGTTLRGKMLYLDLEDWTFEFIEL
jgi:molybdopterin-synthase adenylyltransferase